MGIRTVTDISLSILISGILSKILLQTKISLRAVRQDDNDIFVRGHFPGNPKSRAHGGAARYPGGDSLLPAQGLGHVIRILIGNLLDAVNDLAVQNIGENPQMLTHTARSGQIINPIDYAIFKQTKIVLDGDVQFYEFDKSTVWSRQEAMHNNVALVYEVIEPLSGGWGIHIPIKGQEVWISGGPTPIPPNTSYTLTHYVAYDLMNELKDPDYLLINQVEEDELHLFIVDYPVRRKDYTGGLGGQAAGIGNNRGGIGGGAGRNHAFIHAGSGYSSFKYQWIVMTHEIGHLLGAYHQYAESDHTGCAGGFYDFLCGPSIMRTSVTHSDRAPYFSEINDFVIWMAMDPTLSDWP